MGTGTLKTWAVDTTILEEGQPFEGLWMVLTGSICWSGAVSAELDPGDWFGETALLNEDVVSPAALFAKSPTTVFRLSAESWTRLARRRPLLGLSVLQRLAATLLVRQPDPVPNRARPCGDGTQSQTGATP